MRSGCAPSPCNSGRCLASRLLAAALYIGLAAIGHLFWEAGQLPLYTLWRTGTPREIVTALIHCTGGDVLITAITLAVAAALARLFRWRAFGWRMVFTAIMLGAAYTVFSEWLNVDIRRSWSYTAAMPVLPLFGTGLTPLAAMAGRSRPGFCHHRLPGTVARAGGCGDAQGRLHLETALCYAGIVEPFRPFGVTCSLQ